MEKELNLVTFMNPFTTESSSLPIQINGNLVDTIDRSGLLFPAGVNCNILLNGVLVPREEWELTFPKVNDQITLKIIPQGGGNGKVILRIALTAALIAGTWGVGSAWGGIGNAAFGSATWAAAGLNTFLTYAGMMLIDQIAPLPTAASSRQREKEPKTFGIESSRNQLSPWGAVPILLGRHRFHPPYAAQPYSEALGDEQYINMLFAIGYSPLHIEDMKLGTIDIDDYVQDAFNNSDYLTNPTDRNIEVYIHHNYSNTTPLKYFKSDIYEESFSSNLTNNNGYVYKTTAANTTDIIIDVTAPNGVYGLSSSGNKNEQTVEFSVEYTQSPYNNNSTWSVSDTGRSITGNNFAIPQPCSYRQYHYVKDAGSHYDTVTGYSYTRIGIDKTSGAWWIATSTGNNNNVSHNSEAGARYNCPNFPGYVAPICAITRSSAGSSMNNSNCVDLRTAELQSNNSSDFVPLTSGNNAQIASGWLKLKMAVQAASSTTIRRGYRFKLPSSGTWDVRLKRLTTDHDPIEDRIYDEIVWTALRSVNGDIKPVLMDGLTLVEIRVRASEQFNGSLEDFTVLAQTICYDYDSGSTSWVLRTTNNPASLFRYVLQWIDATQTRFNKRPVATSKINLTDLATWHAYCISQGFAFNLYCDYQTSVYDMLVNIAAEGRSSPTYRDGKYTVITDKEQTTINQHFTPRTSSDFSSSKAFYTPPHAFRVTLADENQDWNTEEVFVYDDNYSSNGANNTTVATIFEEMKLIGCTSQHDAWKQGRFHLAQLRLRPETMKIKADVEHIVCTRGDLVRVTHDAPLWGLASGRVKSLPQDMLTNSKFEDWEDDPLRSMPNNWHVSNTYCQLGAVASNNYYKICGQRSVKTTYNNTYLVPAGIMQVLGANSAVVMARYGVEGNNVLPFANTAYGNQQIIKTGGVNNRTCLKISERSGAWFNGTDLFPIGDPTSEGFIVEATLKNLDPGNGNQYLGLACYDSNNQEITPFRCFRYTNTTTTLYADYVAGANYVDIVPSSNNWLNSTAAYIQLDCTDDANNDFPYPVTKVFRLNNVDMSNNTYWRAYFYSSKPSSNYNNGTKVACSYGGGPAYCVMSASNYSNNNNWFTVRGYIAGINNPYSAPANHEIRIGTKYVALTFCGHYGNTGSFLLENLVVKKFTNPTPSLIGQTITLSGWARSTDGAYARLRLASNDHDAYSNNAPMTGNWTFLTVSSIVTENDKKFIAGVYSGNGAGNFFFDGLQLTIGNNVTSIVLDETVTMTANNNHCIRIRNFAGNSITGNVTTVVGENNTITVSGITTANGVMPGDLFMFGRNNSESVECLVKSIRPTDDLSAEIELVDYSPAVYTADTSTIPDYDTHISTPTSDIAPVISAVRSDERVMIKRGNIWSPRIMVNFSPRASSALKTIAYMEGNFKVAYSTAAWVSIGNVPKDHGSVYIDNVEQGVTYWLRFRYIYRDGHAGPWCSTYSHQVVGKSGNPSDATFDDVNCVFEANRIQFAMNSVLDFDFDFYEIRTADSNWGEATGLICQTKQKKFIYTGLLEINDTYYLKARDTSGNYSVNADSISNGAAPDTLDIGTITVDFSTSDCVLTWAQVDYLKFAYYQVTAYSDAGHSTLIYTSGQFTNPTFVFDFATNSATSGGPYRTVYFRVTVHDIYGRTDYSDAYGTNAEPAIITDLAMQAAINSLILTCSPMFGDVIGYEFACDTDNPPTDSVEVATNFASFLNLTPGVTYYGRARARDVFGYSNNWSSVANATPESVDIDSLTMEIPITSSANWNANNGNAVWDAHTLTYQGNSYNMAAGNAGANIFVYWNVGNANYETADTMPVDGNKWLMCYRNGNNAYPAFQQRIIHGGLIQANTINANRIMAGTLYIGNIVGSTGSLNFSSTGSFNFASANGTFAISAGNINISAASGMNISSGNGIRIQAGSGLFVAGNASSPGIIRLYKNAMPSNNYITLYGYNDYFVIGPGTNNEELYFGLNAARWSTLWCYANNNMYLYSGNYLDIRAIGGNAYMYMYSNGLLGLHASSLSLSSSLNDSYYTFFTKFQMNTYTGDGNTISHNLTGFYFQPKLIRIYPQNGSDGAALECWEKSALQPANGSYYDADHFSYYNSKGIKTINSNGFTVWGSGHPNVSGTVYVAMAWG